MRACALRLALVVAFVAGTGGCGGARVAHAPAPRWPGAGPVPLELALRATAAALELAPPILPDGTRALPLEASSTRPPGGASEPCPYDATGLHARSAVFEGLWYAEVVVGEVAPDAPLPLVVALHGRGDMPRLPGGPFRRAPTPMRLLVPRGPLVLGAGYAWARYSVAQNHPDELAEDLGGAADRIARLTEHVRATRPTLGTPIVTGFSQGAILAWMTALSHPTSFGLALLIAGWVPPRAIPVAPIAGPPRVRAMHGTEDAIVPIEGSREVVSTLRALDLDVELTEFDGAGHAVTDEMNQLFEAWLEEGLAERAPGLSGGPGIAGPDPEPFDAYAPPLSLESPDAVALPGASL